MSKTKITLAAIGGVSGLAIVAAGVFMWLQMSARTAAIEGDDSGADGLETVQSKADRLLRQSVRPCDESVKELNAARDELLAWKTEAFAFAARGDREIVTRTDAAFKDFLIQDSKRLLSLSSETTNKTLSTEFDFGPFKPYIAEGKMPERDNLQVLQRQWDDIALIIETLSSNGVACVTALDVAKTEVAPKETATAKNKKTKKSAKKAAVPEFKPSSFSYTLTFTSRPSAFVKTLNSFETIERFVVVDDFVIRRTKDTLAEALSDEKKDEVVQTSRRGRRRSSRVEEVEEAKVEKPTITVVTDPAHEEPFEVVLKLTVHDFKSKEPATKEEEEK